MRIGVGFNLVRTTSISDFVSHLTFLSFFWTVAETGVLVIDLVMIGAAVGLIIGIIAKSGLGSALTLVLSQLGQGNFGLLLALAAVVCIVLGMGMPTIGVYVLYFGMLSFITPPICIAAFAAAKLAGSDPMATGFEATRFGWSAFVVPFLFIFSPSLLLEGPPLQVLHDVSTALAGVWMVSIGLVGYFRRRLGIGLRVGTAIAGLALLFPASAMGGAIWTDVFGLVLGAAILAREFATTRVRMA